MVSLNFQQHRRIFEIKKEIIQLRCHFYCSNVAETGILDLRESTILRE